MPVYNQAHCLDWTLRSLTNQTTCLNSFEVIVVDDASTQNVSDIVKQYDAKLRISYLRHDPNKGRSASRNLGAAHAEAERILLMDADSYAAPSLVERHLRSAGDETPEVVFGRRAEPSWGTLSKLRKGTIQDRSLLPLEGDHRDEPDSDENGFNVYRHTPWMFAYTHNLSLPRDLYMEVGGFDEAFIQWGYEDTDFTYRIFRHFGRDGSHFLYDSTATCYHMPHFRNWTREWENTRPALPYLVEKYRHFDVELFTYPSENHRRVARTLPYYEECVDFMRHHPGRVSAEAVQESIRMSTSGEGLWIGFETGSLGSKTECLTSFDHSHEFSLDNPHLFGVRTHFMEDSFEHVVNVDLWRMLTPIDLSALVLEGLRIAHSIYLVLSKKLQGAPDNGIGMIDDPNYFLSTLVGQCDARIFYENTEMYIIRLMRHV